MNKILIILKQAHFFKVDNHIIHQQLHHLFTILVFVLLILFLVVLLHLFFTKKLAPPIMNLHLLLLQLDLFNNHETHTLQLILTKYCHLLEVGWTVKQQFPHQSNHTLRGEVIRGLLKDCGNKLDLVHYDYFYLRGDICDEEWYRIDEFIKFLAIPFGEIHSLGVVETVSVHHSIAD